MRSAALGLSLAVPALLLAAAWLQPLYHPSALTRDPLAVVSTVAERGLPCCSRFTGAISTLGVMLWSATAAVTLLAAILTSGLGAPRSRVWLFGTVCGLTIWMGLDDAFMLHEGYAPKPFGFNLFNLVPILAMFPVLALWFRAGNRANDVVLAGALAALAMSLVVDDLVPGSYTTIFVEDAFKFVGICLWTTTFALTAIDCILEAAPLRPRNA